MPKTPTDFWKEYRFSVYDPLTPLNPDQERDASNAFYAGIESVFKFLENSDPNEHDDITTARLVLFRRQNKIAALSQNVNGES